MLIEDTALSMIQRELQYLHILLPIGRVQGLILLIHSERLMRVDPAKSKHLVLLLL